MEKTELFNEIYRTHHTKVYRLCKGYFSGDESRTDETVQEIFIKIWDQLETFRNESKVSTWIYRISVNTCLMSLRKAASKREVVLKELPDTQSDVSESSSEEKLKLMYECIGKLDETSRLIILMVLEGVESIEISETTGISEETLRVRIHRIKKKLSLCVKA